jgi:hypothetical protein
VGRALELEFRGTLTTLQETAARALLRHDVGVLVAPPGISKTVAGIFLVAKRARSTLVLVHRQPLLDQWIAQLSLFLDVEEKSIGRVGGGKRRLTGRIDVAMIQSLLRDHEVDDLVAEYGHVVVDECHHVPARGSTTSGNAFTIASAGILELVPERIQVDVDHAELAPCQLVEERELRHTGDLRVNGHVCSTRTISSSPRRWQLTQYSPTRYLESGGSRQPSRPWAFVP